MRRFSGDKPEKKRPSGRGTVGKPENERHGSSGSRYSDKSRNEKSDSPWKKTNSEDKPWKKRESSSDRPADKPWKKRESSDRTSDKPWKKRESSSDRSSDKPWQKKQEGGESSWRGNKDSDGKSWRDRKEGGEKSWRSSHNSDDKPWSKRRESSDKPWGDKKEPGSRPWKDKKESDERPWRDKRDEGRSSQASGDKTWRGRREPEEKPWKGNSGDDKPWRNKPEGDERPRRSKFEGEDKPWAKRESRGGEERSGNERRSFGTRNRDENKPWVKRESRSNDDRPGEEGRSTGSKREGREDKPWAKRENSGRENSRGEKKSYGSWKDKERSDDKPSRFRNDREERPGDRSERTYDKGNSSSDKFRKPKKESYSSRKSSTSEDGLVRLNKYIANAGISSRREADEMITAGAIKVNGVIVTELGTKVGPTDKVQIGDETLNPQKKVYLLLNKPKGYITTVDDPQERNTVMMLVKDACRERIYPVGRLDRNTSGLLLMTNDGELAKKLTHPSHKVRKIYHVELNKSFSKSDMVRMTEGVELEDGIMAVDEIAYTGTSDDKKTLGVVIHSGKNRVVRRIFEALEYEVVKLDRVVFANLTKKDLPRGRWRFLEESEINTLMMI